jgi:hypothetical protein
MVRQPHSCEIDGDVEFDMDEWGWLWAMVLEVTEAEEQA